MTLTSTGKIKGQAGGIMTAKLSRDRALTRYYADPNICKQCFSILTIPEGIKIGSIFEHQVFLN